MPTAPKLKNAQYISASRRTDLPRFRTDEFFAAWEKGEITYDGGYGRSYTVSLREEDVLGYVFWSKDYEPFIAHPAFKRLIQRNNAVFFFTINDIPELESGVPPLRPRLKTARRLCDLVGPERVLWRYDPICKYRNRDGDLVITDEPFFSILPEAAGMGVRTCFFSFVTGYAKLKRRSVRFEPFGEAEKRTMGNRMLQACREHGVTLYNCCNEEVPQLVPGITQAHCIDDRILRETDRFGVHRTLRPKPTRPGCGCYESRDIGSYNPPCPHGCVYCYANPG